MHLNKKTNKLIAEFMGYIYYHSGVDIDNSDCGGIYEKTEVFSKVPILVNDYDECVYFKDVPNPDYRKVNTMWNNDIEFISWSTLNYKDYITDGDGPKRFAIWSGDENISTKEQIKAVYNLNENLTGKKIKILLGSPSIKEGVSLKGVRQVHILEPYWNLSRLEQIIGRASRFCSHKDLSEEKRNVKVYIYIAVSKGYLNSKNDKSIDQRIELISLRKNKVIKIFERVIKESAVDCELNKNANVYEGEEDIKCEK